MRQLAVEGERGHFSLRVGQLGEQAVQIARLLLLGDELSDAAWGGQRGEMLVAGAVHGVRLVAARDADRAVARDRQHPCSDLSALG